MNDIQPITLPGIDPRRPLVIAGPCSAETEEQGQNRMACVHQHGSDSDGFTDTSVRRYLMEQ